ncbi:hypothetical protein CH333_00765 [candidate division WOR-3 bacterium JGI_Cruoil_03_44_89]|uniref:Sialidase domain-containing protein n=1 Tax=candidate division WOR-3 bacterium JGI_Cruoil_03_44_89 TaxID=1973748 RepID=A0A235BYR4_UNCW3|nr:MAG: hypothetical protein CH333_00765 [candidate division WOR-3 bacterium JGI_Cruoil_03_44_89]
MYLYSDGLCGRRFPGELMLYVPSLSDPHLLSIDSLRETHCIVESPDGRIFADGRKQGIGVIYVSEDGGYTWSETAPLTNTLSVNCISSSFPFSLDPMDTDSPGREIRGTYIGRRLPKTGTM